MRKYKIGPGSIELLIDSIDVGADVFYANTIITLGANLLDNFEPEDKELKDILKALKQKCEAGLSDDDYIILCDEEFEPMMKEVEMIGNLSYGDIVDRPPFEDERGGISSIAEYLCELVHYARILNSKI